MIGQEIPSMGKDMEAEKKNTGLNSFGLKNKACEGNVWK